MSRGDIGVYGLGVMGSALALNLAEQGFDVAVSNREVGWIADFVAEAGPLAARLHPHSEMSDFVAGLKTPRVILFMIPSGVPMDDMIRAVTPLLEAGDTIIDGGNANFHDTRRRAAALATQGLHFVGMGVSGGETGARHGPSMMVGGTAQSWTQLEPMLRAIAARYEGDPCVAHLGPDGAGHFVKTVHNGIEYADMQMIAEAYGLMRFGMGMSASDIGAQFEAWNKGPLRSYLVEITGALLKYEAAGAPFVDHIRDAAGQKGTGRWTVIEALHMGQSASLIEAAIGARSWSSEKALRERLAAQYGGARGAVAVGLAQIEQALMAGRILAYAQGFRILRQAAQDYDWPLDFARIAQIWRAGCIIRSALLDDIAEAFEASGRGGQLLEAEVIADRLQGALPGLRAVAAAALGAGHPAPALNNAVSFFDSLRIASGTANIIQAQRDFFGRHGFERLDQGGQHHGPWWD
ncbi:NADP-dependent phosphogluconate dehydrogenase [Lentibacter sp.]|uniref:NADP-dependent phosphogluconate dehydrogenase n=1 Tax=Lentibacter sp. TaxID=2024994 RepID=UPI003F6962EF